MKGVLPATAVHLCFQILKTVYLPEEALIWLAEKQSKQAQEAKVSRHFTTM